MRIILCLPLLATFGCAHEQGPPASPTAPSASASEVQPVAPSASAKAESPRPPDRDESKLDERRRICEGATRGARKATKEPGSRP